MKNIRKYQARAVQGYVQAIEGGLVIILICLQMACSINLSVFIFCIAINQIQYAFTSWCPITYFINNVGWIRSN